MSVDIIPEDQSNPDSLTDILHDALVAFRSIDMFRRADVKEIRAKQAQHSDNAEIASEEPIFLYILANLTFTVRLIVYRRFGDSYVNTSLALYEETENRYEPVDIAQLVEALSHQERQADRIIKIGIDLTLVVDEIRRAVESAKLSNP